MQDAYVRGWTRRCLPSRRSHRPAGMIRLVQSREGPIRCQQAFCRSAPSRHCTGYFTQCKVVHGSHGKSPVGGLPAAHDFALMKRRGGALRPRGRSSYRSRPPFAPNPRPGGTTIVQRDPSPRLLYPAQLLCEPSREAIPMQSTPPFHRKRGRASMRYVLGWLLSVYSSSSDPESAILRTVSNHASVMSRLCS